MSKENEVHAVAETFLTGLRDRDWQARRSITTEDPVWTYPGFSLISATAQRVGAVIAPAQRITTYERAVGLKHVLVGQTGVALSLKQHWGGEEN